MTNYLGAEVLKNSLKTPELRIPESDQENYDVNSLNFSNTSAKEGNAVVMSVLEIVLNAMYSSVLSQKQMSSVMDAFNDILSGKSESMLKLSQEINTQRDEIQQQIDAQIAEQKSKQEDSEGILGFVSSIVEFVIGVATVIKGIATENFADIAAGTFAMYDGLSKFAGTLCHELGVDTNLTESLRRDGVYGLLAICGVDESSISKVKSVVDVVLMVTGTAFLIKGASKLMTGYVLSNAVVMAAGLITASAGGANTGNKYGDLFVSGMQGGIVSFAQTATLGGVEAISLATNGSNEDSAVASQVLAAIFAIATIAATVKLVNKKSANNVQQDPNSLIIDLSNDSNKDKLNKIFESAMKLSSVLQFISGAKNIEEGALNIVNNNYKKDMDNLQVTQQNEENKNSELVKILDQVRSNLDNQLRELETSSAKKSGECIERCVKIIDQFCG